MILNPGSSKLKPADTALIKDDVPFSQLIKTSGKAPMAAIIWCLMQSQVHQTVSGYIDIHGCDFHLLPLPE